MATKCVFIYARISEDKGGRSEGVQAQERRGREYAAEHWPGMPIRVYADNDMSAAKEDVHRPQFEAMRDAIRRGECAQLWTVEQSRLTRLESVWFTFAAELIKAGIDRVHTWRDGLVDVDGITPGIKAVVNAHEVRRLRERVADKMADLATQGRPAGGAIFGYRKRIYTAAEEAKLDRWREARRTALRRGEDMIRWKEQNPRPAVGRRVLDEQGRASMEIVPEQAAIVRQAAEWVLDGWTLHAVAQELHGRGVRGPNGGGIGGRSVKQWLTSPSIAALRVHQGQIIGKAAWEPILDEATWRALRAALLTDRPQRPARVKPRKFLLTRIAWCVRCDLPMMGGNRPDYHQYICHSDHRAGCGRAISGEPLDRYVIRKLFEYVSRREIAAPGDDENAERRRQIVVELRALDARRQEWIKAKDAGQLDLGEYLSAKAKFDEEEKRLNVELAGLPEAVEHLDPAMLRESWPEWPFHRKRQVIEDYIRTVSIQPSPRMVGLRKVAKAAGVSSQTAWRVFTPERDHYGTTSEKTRLRVLDAANKLGYVYRPGAHRVRDDDLDALVNIDWR